MYEKEGWGSDNGGDEDGWGDDAEDGNEEDGWGDGDGDDNANDDPKIEIENCYYEAEGNIKDDPQLSYDQMKKCIELETKLGDEI